MIVQLLVGAIGLLEPQQGVPVLVIDKILDRIQGSIGVGRKPVREFCLEPGYQLVCFGSHAD